jgi:hypothetical protein
MRMDLILKGVLPLQTNSGFYARQLRQTNRDLKVS